MGNPETVDAFVDRIVTRARIASRSERDDLRRELRTHFEDAGSSPGAAHDAMRRFGREDLVVESLRRVYRWDYACAYLVKIAAAVAGSIVVALAVEVLAHLRVQGGEDALRLGPGFSHGALVGIAVALALVAYSEIRRPPFTRWRAVTGISAYVAACALVGVAFAGGSGAFVTAAILAALGALSSRAATPSVRVLITFLVFGAAEYVMHLTMSVPFGPARAAIAAAVLVTVWTSSGVIVARLDRAFDHWFEIT